MAFLAFMAFMGEFFVGEFLAFMAVLAAGAAASFLGSASFLGFIAFIAAGAAASLMDFFMAAMEGTRGNWMEVDGTILGPKWLRSMSLYGGACKNDFFKWR
jgi:hypothetical protein